MFANSSYESRTQTESALAQMQLKQLGDINFIATSGVLLLAAIVGRSVHFSRWCKP